MILRIILLALSAIMNVLWFAFAVPFIWTYGTPNDFNIIFGGTAAHLISFLAAAAYLNAYRYE